MRVAQAEEVFRALLANLGFRRFRLAVSPIWSYAEYLLDETIEVSRNASRRTGSAVRRRAEGWRFLLRRLVAGPLYAAARLPMPPSTRGLLEESRALLPTLRPLGELLTYVGETALELRSGAQIVLNVAPHGCMVSSMGELLSPAIERLGASAGRGRIQHLFSAEGDLNEELLMLATLKSLGPEQFYERAANLRTPS
jgi:hypothetical protein